MMACSHNIPIKCEWTLLLYVFSIYPLNRHFAALLMSGRGYLSLNYFSMEPIFTCTLTLFNTSHNFFLARIKEINTSPDAFLSKHKDVWLLIFPFCYMVPWKSLKTIALFLAAVSNLQLNRKNEAITNS